MASSSKSTTNPPANPTTGQHRSLPTSSIQENPTSLVQAVRNLESRVRALLQEVGGKHPAKHNTQVLVDLVRRAVELQRDVKRCGEDVEKKIIDINRRLEKAGGQKWTQQTEVRKFLEARQKQIEEVVKAAQELRRRLNPDYCEFEAIEKELGQLQMLARTGIASKVKAEKALALQGRLEVIWRNFNQAFVGVEETTQDPEVQAYISSKLGGVVKDRVRHHQETYGILNVESFMLSIKTRHALCNQYLPIQERSPGLQPVSTPPKHLNQQPGASSSSSSPALPSSFMNNFDGPGDFWDSTWDVEYLDFESLMASMANPTIVEIEGQFDPFADELDGNDIDKHQKFGWELVQKMVDHHVEGRQDTMAVMVNIGNMWDVILGVTIYTERMVTTMKENAEGFMDRPQSELWGLRVLVDEVEKIVRGKEGVYTGENAVELVNYWKKEQIKPLRDRLTVLAEEQKKGELARLQVMAGQQQVGQQQQAGPSSKRSAPS